MKPVTSRRRSAVYSARGRGAKLGDIECRRLWASDAINHGAFYPGGLDLVPREQLLDVVALRSEFTGGFAECPAIINSLLDREPFRGRGADEEVEFRHSVERRASPVRSQGRIILQRTRTSRADFIRGDRTPGATTTSP